MSDDAWEPFTAAAGAGTTRCVALETCDFVVTATDADGNYRLNTGADTFVVEITGVDDWAGEGRTNEYDGPCLLYTSPSPRDPL